MTRQRSILARYTFSLCRAGVLAGMVSVVLATGVQNPRKTAASDQTKEGRTIFEGTCAGCHGLDGRGGERGPDISSRQQVVQLSDEKILDILRRGIPAAGMPPFASLGAAKLNAVLAYLRLLEGKGASVVLAGDPQKGKAVFSGKARCSACHMVGGVGGFLGRDLTLYGANLSPQEIHNNIVNPPEGLGNDNRTAVITMLDSQKLSGIIRNEDNFSVQLQSFDGSFHLLNKSDVNKLEFLPDPIMPKDYGTTLSTSEIDDLVSYLVTAARASQSVTKRNPDDETE